MSIELHCPQCQKLIRAPDNAGGHRGKCPYCSNSVYIPMPTSDDDIIKIAPVDDAEERRTEEERRRAIRYAAMVDHATEGTGPGVADAEPSFDDSPGEVVDLHAEVETYVLSMRDSKLDAAEAAVSRMRRIGTRARDFVEGLFLDEMPPEFENVPPPVAKGFLKRLLDQLGK
jgi:hypothetical protein